MLNDRKKIIFLTIASFIFYAYGYPPYLLILLYSICLNYFCALKISSASSQIRKRQFLFLNIFGNLAVLGFYKYINFVIDVFCSTFRFLKLEFPQDILKFSLPLGISFFTFQAMAYNIDVYKGIVKAKKSFVQFSFFISFFTQLIAGPILRTRDFFPQLVAKKRFKRKSLEMGFYLILWGLIKKVVIADNLAPLVNEYFANPLNTFLNAWVAIYAFAFQIYCDFSGYCDIAIGCARILDYNIPLNFKQPYLAQNITLFWRHWHITLSNWFRDYLFIPLGGSKVQELRYYSNLLVTMVIAGLWHGANYTFIIWGLYHGLLLILHKIYKRCINIKIPKLIGILVTFHLVCIGWIFFRANNINLAWNVLGSAFKIKNFGTINFSTITNLIFFSLPLLVLQVFERRFSLKQNFVNFSPWVKSIFVIVAILSITLFGTTGNEFIYFEF
jgi:D-alanyl-lipoteichoic acid acyltransferase DltB (MBOAT superfamily)